MFRRKTVAVTAAVALLASGGCDALGSTHADEAAPISQGLEKPHVSVGVISSIRSSPLYIAKQQGFFEQEGLPVEPVPIDGRVAGPAKVIAIPMPPLDN